MEQELISNKRIAVIGSGPAGCTAAKYLSDYGFDVTIFDKGKFLHTILPTGGGRCNLAFAEYDFKELAKNYPRGEKFLYSPLSKFSTAQTVEFIRSLGIKTYTQDDLRIFPVSNSSAEVREKLLKVLKKCGFLKEEVLKISKLDNGYKIKTNKSDYVFDVVIAAIGGHSGVEILSGLKINIIPQTQALVGLVTEGDFSVSAGASIKNVRYKDGKTVYSGDILFTHKGVSGPLIYKISSLKARDTMPYKIRLQLIEDFNLQEYLNKNPHKEIKNLLGNFVPKSFALYLLENLRIPPETPCHNIDGKTRNKIYGKLTDFEVTVTEKAADGEVVTCGGVDLKEINPKTLEAKNYPNLYFCGEILDIDGFCGGFNLQNCWTTGFTAADSIRIRYK